jgi:S-adenosylmethionine/arginine decarboxylase-like enzyme
MNIGREIVDMQQKLAGTRATYDSHCQEVAEVLLPRQNDLFNNETKPEGEKNSQKIISSVALEALNKFAAAMESILTPRSSRWHGLSTTNQELNNNQEVREYFDNITDILFQKRYSTKANYASQQHETYMSLGAFGTGVLIVEDFAKENGIRYKSSHIAEHFFMENVHGIIDVDYRLYKLTARQAVQKFKGGNLPEKIVNAAEKNPHEKFDFIHCVKPNDDIVHSMKDYRGAKYSSYHVAVEGNTFINQGGFRTFPYIISRYVTSPNEIYGRSPGMTALSEIKMLNAMRKSDLRARHMAIDPPVLTSDERALRRPLIKPGGINFGALDAAGNPLIKPYGNQTRIDVSNDAMNASHEIINDIFLVKLFQILVESPQMTATEVLQRAQEKGDLLSPSAGRQQSESQGRMIEREIDLLTFAGLLPPMPDILLEAGGEYEVEYTAPLNVLQKAGQAAATTQIINDAIPIAQIDPTIMDNFDFDEYINIMRDARNAPSRLFRSDDEIKAIRQQKAQEQQMQQLVAAAPQVAGSIKDIAQAGSYAQQ